MIIDAPHVGRARAGIKAGLIARYRATNVGRRRSILGDAPVAVSLTSYGHRLTTVAHTVESIAAGHTRPQRIILWVDDPGFSLKDYPMLRRLVSYGLEIGGCADLGPHKKYYPYCTSGSDLLPLVTADDDILYPRRWLHSLVAAHVVTPDLFVGVRAKTIQPSEADESAFAPYGSWPATQATRPSHRSFITGGAGAVYPRALMHALGERGTAFLDAAPRADDVWINAVAADRGIRARRVESRLLSWSYPGSQKGALHMQNVNEGGNDSQIAASYPSKLQQRVLLDPSA